MIRRAWLAALLLAPLPAACADPDALWKIVSTQCVPRQQAEHDPSPCAVADLTQGYALLKDRAGIAQFLLLPTTRVTGIEDPQILAPDAPAYWDTAWRSRYFIEQRLHAPLPRDAMSLAVNSARGRTQDQLHIHIDCIRPDVRAALARHLDTLRPAWTQFPEPLAGHAYRALRTDTLTGESDPFRILAATDGAEMRLHTLVVAGATFPDGSEGFVLLDNRAQGLDFASGEELQDHGCAIAAK
jgi:CDP-diacylglycerol pyrophosphatase